MNSRDAISAFDRPRLTSSNTSCSRTLNADVTSSGRWVGRARCRRDCAATLRPGLGTDLHQPFEAGQRGSASAMRLIAGSHEYRPVRGGSLPAATVDRRCRACIARSKHAIDSAPSPDAESTRARAANASIASASTSEPRELLELIRCGGRGNDIAVLEFGVDQQRQQRTDAQGIGDQFSDRDAGRQRPGRLAALEVNCANRTQLVTRSSNGARAQRLPRSAPARAQPAR
jgi:hypothetical protein